MIACLITPITAVIIVVIIIIIVVIIGIIIIIIIIIGVGVAVAGLLFSESNRKRCFLECCGPSGSICTQSERAFPRVQQAVPSCWGLSLAPFEVRFGMHLVRVRVIVGARCPGFVKFGDVGSWRKDGGSVWGPALRSADANAN
eukprot:2764025-Rhodomonas_salina.1